MSLLKRDKHRSMVSVDRCPGVGSGYGDALQTLIDLRHCEGSVAVHPTAEGDERPLDLLFFIWPRREGVGVVSMYLGPSSSAFLSPAFATREDAEAAIAEVGVHAVERMFETLSASFGEGGDSGA